MGTANSNAEAQTMANRVSRGQFEESLALTREALRNNTLYRIPLLNILRFCTEERELDEVLAFISGMPEMETATRTSLSLVNSMVNSGALVRSAIADGVRLSYDDYLRSVEEGASYEQVEFRLATTEAGAKAIGENGVDGALASLRDARPDCAVYFDAILAYCVQPRSYRDVSDEIARIEASRFGAVAKIQPSYVLERLHETGALDWKGGWETTAQGEAALRTLNG